VIADWMLWLEQNDIGWRHIEDFVDPSLLEEFGSNQEPIAYHSSIYNDTIDGDSISDPIWTVVNVTPTR
jgi:hypothetical protein